MITASFSDVIKSSREITASNTDDVTMTSIGSMKVHQTDLSLGESKELLFMVSKRNLKIPL